MKENHFENIAAMADMDITEIPKTLLEKSEFKKEPIFNLSYPLDLAGVDSKVLNPREAWIDVHSYDKQAAMLVNLFYDNFKTYGSSVSPLESAGPSRNEALII